MLHDQPSGTSLSRGGKSNMVGVYFVNLVAHCTWKYIFGEPACLFSFFAVKAGGKRVVKKNSEDTATPEKESKRPDKPRYRADLKFKYPAASGVHCC